MRKDGSTLVLAWLLVVASAALNGAVLIVDNIEPNELGKTAVEITVYHVTMSVMTWQVCVTHASLSRSCCNLRSALAGGLSPSTCLTTFCGIWLIRRSIAVV